ncbi:MAG: HK97 family phage prohead protease [Rhizobiaceae bacterium]|nr:HK97 family phage prohead protease [Rhizobiaceae bacterium]
MGHRQILAGERKRVELRLGDVESDGSFSGYASLFGRVDLGRDIVERGAFARSLAKRGASGIRMLFQHDPAAPIGSWSEVREDARGLFVRGRLALDSAKARDIHALMRGGALDGLSIGFRTVRARKETKSGVRRILEADLWEISVVTFPMLPEARVDSVKSRRRSKTPQTQEFAPDRLMASIRRATRMLNDRSTKGNT